MSLPNCNYMYGHHQQRQLRLSALLFTSTLVHYDRLQIHHHQILPLKMQSDPRYY